MKYRNEQNFRHDAPESLGVLMVNMGTPDSSNTADVRRYLAEFLADPRVVEMPRLLWMSILHGVILRVRPRRSAHAYARVWTERGSPLMDNTLRQARALQQTLQGRFRVPVKLVPAMRYGAPSVAEGLRELQASRARRILVLPMYPQYSATTTASVFDAVTAELRTWRWVPEMRFINQYHDHPGYADALVSSIRTHWDTHARPDRLLFSFHGIPREYFLNGDPYHCQCHKTARVVAEQLGLAGDQWQLSFQSRVGAKEWLKPYTEHTLREWGAAGVGHVQVVCPGFSADCLETLEEIAVENRGYFLAAGGKDYGYIPALNDSPDHIQALADLVQAHMAGWPRALEGQGPDGGQRLRRAQALGAEF